MTANFGDYQLLPIFIASVGIIVIAAESDDGSGRAPAIAAENRCES